jgi:hypothetical protein
MNLIDYRNRWGARNVVNVYSTLASWQIKMLGIRFWITDVHSANVPNASGDEWLLCHTFNIDIGFLLFKICIAINFTTTPPRTPVGMRMA